MMNIFLDSPQINKAIYNNKDERQNLNTLDALKSSELDNSFIDIVKKQADSVACLVSNHCLIKKPGGGWQLHSETPTLANVVENEFHERFKTNETFGEQESFRNEHAAGFGTAFLVGKLLTH